MTTWTRDGSAIDISAHTFHVKLTPHQWLTPAGGQQTNPGYDKGGELTLIREIDESIRETESFTSYVVSRRASRTMFSPEILAEGDALPEYMCTEHRLGGLGLGPQYDMYVSFTTKEQATMFKLSFRGDVGVGFSGIN